MFIDKTCGWCDIGQVGAGKPVWDGWQAGGGVEQTGGGRLQAGFLVKADYKEKDSGPEAEANHIKLSYTQTICGTILAVALVQHVTTDYLDQTGVKSWKIPTVVARWVDE